MSGHRSAVNKDYARKLSDIPDDMPRAEANGKPYNAHADPALNRGGHKLPSAPPSAVASAPAPVYGCQTREEWLPGWMGIDAYEALYELEALWGDEPQHSVIRVFSRNICTGSFGEIWAAQLAASIEAQPVDYKPAVKLPEYRNLQRLQVIHDETGELPQSTNTFKAGKMVITVDDSKPGLIVGPVATPAKTNAAEVEDKIAKTIKARGVQNIDELISDIKDDLENFEARQDEKGRVQLIDNCYLKKNGIWINLLNPKLMSCVVIRTELMHGEGPLVTIKRSEIHDWLVKVHNASSITPGERAVRDTLKRLTEGGLAMDAIRAKAEVGA